MILKRRIEELKELRTKFAWVILWYVLIAFPLLLATLYISWGSGFATFVTCLIGVWAIYHLIDGIKEYKAIKYAEDRLRRAYALGDQGAGQKGAE